MRILVADDDASCRETIAAALREEGHVVVAASDGRAAVEFVQSRRPALVLTDLHMPHFDGTEVLQVVRRECPGAAVMIITADGDAHARMQVSALRADGYLLKPIDLDDMFDRIERLVDRN